MGFNKQTRGQDRDSNFPRLLGERLCLDYVNTVESPRDNPHEFLFNYADLVRWGRHVAVLDKSEVETLLREGEHHPDEAAAVFERAINLRDLLTRIFRAIAHGHAAELSDLQHLQTEYLHAMSRAQITPSTGGYVWNWDANESALDRPLWVIARSAVEVLTTDDLRRIKECPGAGDCGWLFYDTSKNNSRRWCSMEGCGSRVKMRRQYARHHP